MKLSKLKIPFVVKVFIIAFLIIAAILFFLECYFGDESNNKVEGIAFELYGLLFDIVLFGIIISIINHRTTKKKEISKFTNELELIRGWFDEEAGIRLLNVIKKLKLFKVNINELLILKSYYFNFYTYQKIKQILGVEIITQNPLYCYFKEIHFLINPEDLDVDLILQQHKTTPEGKLLTHNTYDTCIFYNIFFERYYFMGGDFINCDFTNLKFENSKFKDVNFKNCKFKNVELVNSVFETCLFNNCEIKDNGRVLKQNIIISSPPSYVGFFHTMIEDCLQQLKRKNYKPPPLQPIN